MRQGGGMSRQLAGPSKPVSVSVDGIIHCAEKNSDLEYFYDPTDGTPISMRIPWVSQTISVQEIESGFIIEGLPFPGAMPDNPCGRKVRVTVELLP